jgi:hypothetical protein
VRQFTERRGPEIEKNKLAIETHFPKFKWIIYDSQGSEINSQTQSFDAYRNSFLRVISVIIEIINYPFKLGKMRFNRQFFFQFPDPP